MHPPSPSPSYLGSGVGRRHSICLLARRTVRGRLACSTVPPHAVRLVNFSVLRSLKWKVRLLTLAQAPLNFLYLVHHSCMIGFKFARDALVFGVKVVRKIATPQALVVVVEKVHHEPQQASTCGLLVVVQVLPGQLALVRSSSLVCAVASAFLSVVPHVSIV